MSILQVSERIIRDKFITLEEKTNKSIYHNESDIFYNNDFIYKIIKPIFRKSREKNMYLIDGKNFPYANNILNLLYQGDKFIGTLSNYLNNLIPMSDYMNKLDLYEIKNIMSYFLDFYKTILDNNLVYWDNHLSNIGISNGKFYILDIDSMEEKRRDIEVYYALNGLLSLFYEMYYKIPIRGKYDNYRAIIHLISECDNYSKCKLTLEEIKKIVDTTSVDYLESKRKILKRFSR